MSYSNFCNGTNNEAPKAAEGLKVRNLLGTQPNFKVQH